MTAWRSFARRIRIPAGFAYGALYLLLADPTGKTIAVGGSIVAAGLAVRALASGHVNKATHLTTTGLYAYTRNPLYLGSIIMGVGFSIAAWNLWLALIMAAVFTIVYLPVIRWEEEYLRQHHPGFQEYTERVPRLIPRLSSAPAAHSFSAALYLKHREYEALLGAVAVLAVLALKLYYRH